MSTATMAHQANRLVRLSLLCTLAVTAVCAGVFAALIAMLPDGAAQAVALGAPFLVFAAAALTLGFIWLRLEGELRRSDAALVRAEGAIHDLSANDALTGAANRAALSEHLKAAVTRAGLHRLRLAVLLIDVNQFRRINEAWGSVAGDLALKEVARRLGELLRHGEFLARTGGDEFAVVVEYASEDCVRRLAHRIVESLCQPLQLDAAAAQQINVCVGVALFPAMAGGEEELLRKAELALRRAKRDDRGAVRMYDASMDVELYERARLELELRESVATPALEPFFQPIVDLRRRTPVGLEILARWRHPTRGLMAPLDFLPAAQSAGLMNDITATVLKGACEAARTFPGEPSLWLNVAAQQVQSNALADIVRRTLAETGFAPERLVVEITDTALLSDLAAARRVIGALKDAGVRLALDNFGVGYSSLSYLAELPFDSIKISSAFVRDIGERGQSAKIVAALAGLARSLGAMSVAEGVETAVQANLLRAIGCEAAQGFHFAKPMCAADAARALAAQPAENRAIA